MVAPQKRHPFIPVLFTEPFKQGTAGLAGIFGKVEPRA
jgi:hypothetical protein